MDQFDIDQFDVDQLDAEGAPGLLSMDGDRDDGQRLR